MFLGVLARPMWIEELLIKKVNRRGAGKKSKAIKGENNEVDQFSFSFHFYFNLSKTNLCAVANM